MNPTNKSAGIRRLIIIAVLILALLIGWSAFRSTGFHATGTSPSLNKINDITQSLSINYNKPLKNALVQGSPSIVKSYKVSGKTIVVSLNYPIRVNVPLNIVVTSVSSTSGAHISGQKFQFTATAATKITPAEHQNLLQTQDQNQGTSDDPIVAYLPHTTLTYNIAAVVSAQPKLTLQATLYLSQADMSNQQQAIATYRQQVLDYITSIGFSPTNYSIDYIISTP